MWKQPLSKLLKVCLIIGWVLATCWVGSYMVSWFANQPLVECVRLAELYDQDDSFIEACMTEEMSKQSPTLQTALAYILAGIVSSFAYVPLRRLIDWILPAPKVHVAFFP